MKDAQKREQTKVKDANQKELDTLSNENNLLIQTLIRETEIRAELDTEKTSHISRDEVYVGTTLVSQALSAGRVSPM